MNVTITRRLTVKYPLLLKAVKITFQVLGVLRIGKHENVVISEVRRGSERRFEVPNGAKESKIFIL